MRVEHITFLNEDYVKKALVENALRKAWLARQLGISSSTLSWLFSHKRKVSPEMRVKLIRVFKKRRIPFGVGGERLFVCERVEFQ